MKTALLINNLIIRFKQLFKKKPKHYKVPLYESDGETFTGWFTEFDEGDTTYKIHMEVYGKIPKKILLD